MAIGPQNYIGKNRQGHGTSFPGVRIGNMPDPNRPVGDDSAQQPVGIPQWPTAYLWLTEAATSDVDAILDDLDANTTGETEVSYTAATDTTTLLPQRRAVIITPSGSSTGTITVTGTIFGKSYTETFTWAAASAAVTGNICFETVTAVNVTSGLGSGVTVDVGFANKFGVPYPMYGNTVFFAGWDDGAAKFPLKDATNFAEGTDFVVNAGQPGTANQDPFGSITIGDAATDPDGTNSYLFFYIPSLFYRDDEAGYSTTEIDYN